MNTTAPTVLILGARGRFGAAAAQAFLARGWRVLAQVRAPAHGLPPGVQPITVPLADTAALARAAAGASVVVHAANPVYTRWAEDLLPMARQGMDVAQALGARFVLPGNVYAYGRHMPALLREDTPTDPDTRKGALRLQLEREMQSRAAQGRLRALVLRAGDFFGAGRGSWLDLAIAKDIGRGKLVYPGPLDRVHAWAYLPDLADALVAAAASPGLPDFATLHFAGHAVTGAEFLATLQQAASRLGLSPGARGWRQGGMPWGLIRAGGWLVPMWRELAEMAYLWEVPHALDGGALQTLIGARPATDLVSAFERSLRAMGVAPQAATPLSSTA